jgi:hypothetical protein
LIIEFAKEKDGSAVLRCTRADGSVSWQKQQGKHAAFFPLHDLTHYAVETELGFRHGFYGLIAEEYLVSAFSAERASGTVTTAAEFNDLAATFASTNEMPEPRKLSDEELGRVRSRFNELAIQWRRLAPGSKLELTLL